MDCEVAVISDKDIENPVLKSLASQLLENGIYFDNLEKQCFLKKIPAKLDGYKTLLIEDNLFYDILEKNNADFKRLKRYAGKGKFYLFSSEKASGTGTVGERGIYNLSNSFVLNYMIPDCGLKMENKKAWKIQAARPDNLIIRELKENMKNFIKGKNGICEFHLHHWKSAVAFLEYENDPELEELLMEDIKRIFTKPDPPIHHDRIGAYFASAWFYDKTNDISLFNEAKKNIDIVLEKRPRYKNILTSSGDIDDPIGIGYMIDKRWWNSGYSTFRRDLIWTENLHFLGPAFSSAFRVSGDKKYLTEVMKLVLYIKKFHQDKDGTLFHVTRFGKPCSSKWSRGNAHALYGMSYMLDELSPESKEFKTVLKFIDSIGSGLLKYQDSSWGLWRNVLDNPASRIESSGSTCFFYVFAKCVNRKWLPENKYYEMLKNAYNGLKKLYWRGGFAANCNGTAVGDENYYLSRPQGYLVIPQFLMALMEFKKI